MNEDKFYNTVGQCVQRLSKNVGKNNLDSWFAIRDLTTYFSAEDDLSDTLSQLDIFQLQVILSGLSHARYLHIRDKWGDHTSYNMHLRAAIMSQFK